MSEELEVWRPGSQVTDDILGVAGRRKRGDRRQPSGLSWPRAWLS